MTVDPLAELLAEFFDTAFGSAPKPDIGGGPGIVDEMFADWLRAHRTELLKALGGTHPRGDELLGPGELWTLPALEKEARR